MDIHNLIGAVESVLNQTYGFDTVMVRAMNRLRDSARRTIEDLEKFQAIAGRTTPPAESFGEPKPENDLDMISVEVTIRDRKMGVRSHGYVSTLAFAYAYTPTHILADMANRVARKAAESYMRERSKTPSDPCYAVPTATYTEDDDAVPPMWPLRRSDCEDK